MLLQIIQMLLYKLIKYHFTLLTMLILFWIGLLLLLLTFSSSVSYFVALLKLNEFHYKEMHFNK